MTHRHLRLFALAFAAAVIATPQAGQLKFESVSIQPRPSNNKDASVPILTSDGRVRANVYFRVWVKEAYEVPYSVDQVGLLAGMPDWLGTEYYEVEATVPPAAFPPGTSIQELRRQLREMKQTMLADRLQLRVHRETREMDTYVVRVGDGGLKLPVAMEEKDCPEPRHLDPNDANVICHTLEGGRGRGVHGRAATIHDVSYFVQQWFDKPLVDKTGLTGLYRIDTTAWLPIEMTGRTIRPGFTQDGVDYTQLPTVFALFERMGLKLVQEKSTVEVLVIDHIERPSTN